jgi:hypothetical protein
MAQYGWENSQSKKERSQTTLRGGHATQPSTLKPNNYTLTLLHSYNFRYIRSSHFYIHARADSPSANPRRKAEQVGETKARHIRFSPRQFSGCPGQDEEPDHRGELADAPSCVLRTARRRNEDKLWRWGKPDSEWLHQ